MFSLNNVSMIRLTSESGAKAVWSASPPGSHDLVPNASSYATRDASANRNYPGAIVRLDSVEPIVLSSPSQIMELADWLRDAACWLTAVNMVSLHMDIEGDIEELDDEYEDEEE